MMATYMIESWCEFAIGTVITLLRILARMKVVGIKGWRGDDYLIIFALLNFILQMWMHQGIYENGMNWALTEDFIASLTDEEVRRREKGSAQNFISWIAYLNLIWSLKFCMLFLYWRLASGLYQRRRLQVCAGFIFLTYIGAWLTLAFHCNPIQKNWQVRPSPGKCSFELPLFYIVGPLNVITDIVLLFIPIPLIKRAKLNMTRKFFVGVLLCGGAFIIVATTLNNLFSLLYTYDNMHGLLNHSLSHPNSDAGWILGWGLRETFTAVVVVNAPCIKPLFSRTAWIKKNTDIIECGPAHSKSNSQGGGSADVEQNLSTPNQSNNPYNNFNFNNSNDAASAQNNSSTGNLAPNAAVTAMGGTTERKCSGTSWLSEPDRYDDDAPAYELATGRPSDVGGRSFDSTAKERYSGVSSHNGTAL